MAPVFIEFSVSQLVSVTLMTRRKALFETTLLSTQVFVNCHFSKDGGTPPWPEAIKDALTAEPGSKFCRQSASTADGAHGAQGAPSLRPASLAPSFVHGSPPVCLGHLLYVWDPPRVQDSPCVPRIPSPMSPGHPLCARDPHGQGRRNSGWEGGLTS